MKNLVKFIKSIKVKQLLTVFLAGCLLTIATACNQDTVAQVKTKADMETSRAVSNDYDKYDANQEYKGGMNRYNDDRRYDAETAAKTKTLIDTAERRKADNLGEYVDNVKERAINGETAEKATKAFSNKLERNKDKAVEYIDEKSDKLQRNLNKVPGEAKKVFDEATDPAQNAVQDANKAARKNANKIKENFEDLS